MTGPFSAPVRRDEEEDSITSTPASNPFGGLNRHKTDDPTPSKPTPDNTSAPSQQSSNIPESTNPFGGLKAKPTHTPAPDHPATTVPPTSQESPQTLHHTPAPTPTVPDSEPVSNPFGGFKRPSSHAPSASPTIVKNDDHPVLPHGSPEAPQAVQQPTTPAESQDPSRVNDQAHSPQSLPTSARKRHASEVHPTRDHDSREYEDILSSIIPNEPDDEDSTSMPGPVFNPEWTEYDDAEDEGTDWSPAQDEQGQTAGIEDSAPAEWDWKSFLDEGDDSISSNGHDHSSTPVTSSGVVLDDRVDLTKHEKSMHRESRIDLDALTAASRDDVPDGENVPAAQRAMDTRALAEGLAVGQGREKFKLIIRTPKAVEAAVARKIQILEWRKNKHIPFNGATVKAFDYLTRWSYATTAQVARVAGWRDSKESRLVKKLDQYAELGWLTEDVEFAGPRLWYPTNAGAELTSHPWLGGVDSKRINPFSQSHSIGLSSIASWLLCPWDNVPNILGMNEDAWRELRSEIKNGETYVVGEREYRSRWSSLRQKEKGLFQKKYRYAFLGGEGVAGSFTEWGEGVKFTRQHHLEGKRGSTSIEDAPEYLVCDPQFAGDGMEVWTLWGNWVWNPKRVIEAAMDDGLDVRGMSPEERTQVFMDYRAEGYVNVDEERYDVSTNRPEVRKDLGDRFALQDHLPDLLLVRKRAENGAARSIAIELELRSKGVDAYARTMASFGSVLGQTLYDKVIWLVPNHTVALAIERGAMQVGLVKGEDYDVVPFATKAKRNSFYSGADILPAYFDDRNRVIPIETKFLTS